MKTKKKIEKTAMLPRRIVVEALQEAELNLEWATEPQYVRLYRRQVNQLRTALRTVEAAVN